MMSFAFIVIAAFLDIVANLLLKKSNGFQSLGYGIGAILMVLLAFIILSFALQSIPLSVAYATWGALGIFGTTLGGILFFKEKIGKKGIYGLILIIGSVILLHF